MLKNVYIVCWGVVDEVGFTQMSEGDVTEKGGLNHSEVNEIVCIESLRASPV